jgi:hypothetical protein
MAKRPTPRPNRAPATSKKPVPRPAGLAEQRDLRKAIDSAAAALRGSDRLKIRTIRTLSSTGRLAAQ